MNSRTINTTHSALSARFAMTEGQIDREFEKCAGALSQYPKRAVMVPAGRPGEDVVEVGYNGRMFLIRRGEAVELPEPLCEVLENAGLIGREGRE